MVMWVQMGPLAIWAWPLSMWLNDWFWVTSLCYPAVHIPKTATKQTTCCHIPNRIFGSKGFHPTSSQRAALARRFHFPSSLSLTRMLITALKLGVKMPTPMPPKTTVPTLGSRLFFIREVKKWASENGGCRRIIGYQPEIMGIHGFVHKWWIWLQYMAISIGR